MEHVIVGSGPAGVIAAENLRKISPNDSVTLIGDESYPAYSRMAIPYMLAGNVDESGTYLRHHPKHFDRLKVNVRNGSATAISPSNQTLTLSDGSTLNYDRLLLTMGASAVRPPISGMDLPQVHNCWTLNDAHRILNQVDAGDRVALLGAGFIGCIVLEALVTMKLKLTVIELEDRMLARMMDHTGGEMIQNWCENKGVEVRTSTKAVGVSQDGDELVISLEDGSSITVDHIVSAAGVRPNIDVLNGSGIETDVGILVDHSLQTNIPEIFAAGDIAQGPDQSTGERQVHAIQPTASEHGRVAAFGMAGVKLQYGGSLSMNVLNTLGLITSSFGLWDGIDGGERAITVDRGSNRYLRLEFREDVLIGALAIGLTQHVGILRGLVQTGVNLGKWKKRLLSDPSLVMNAYLEQVQGTRS